MNVIIHASVESRKCKLTFPDSKYVENFKSLFTTLECDKASRAIFSQDVSIRYYADHCVELIPEGEFAYRSIRAMLDHMMNYGFDFDKGVLANILKQACKLEMEGMVILGALEDPSYVVSILQDSISLFPVAERYLDPSTRCCKEFIECLKNSSTITDFSMDPNICAIVIVVSVGMYSVLTSLSNAMVKGGVIEQGDKEHTCRCLIDLALENLAITELKVVKNITSYPKAHPLSKYKDVAKGVEDIFRCLGDKKRMDPVLMKQLKDALEGKGKFSAAPSILMKGFTKLNQNFGPQLENIIASKPQP